MTVHRVMGIETEYGISVPGRVNINSMLASAQVVNAYAGIVGAAGRRTGWDYHEESPLRDARGMDMTRADADPSQLTDEDTGMSNVILPNGARLYVDHAHPEYSSPEVTNPLDAVIWDAAGELIMERAASRVRSLVAGTEVRLYKNNTDNKGASYGCHENYLMRRDIPFADVVTHLTPFFVSRQVFTGSGRVGIGQNGAGAGFQLSQRADFMETGVGLETTMKRPIINTRDEPHADPAKYRRLHVIVGDANLAQVATYLKMGTTALTLSVLEADLVDPGLVPLDPVAEMHAVSHDTTLTHRIRLRDGRCLTAIQLQWEFHDAAAKLVDDRLGTAVDEQTADVLTRWADTLDQLSRDPMVLADTLDWVAKKVLLDGYRARDGRDWSDPRLALVDLQYSDVRRERGVAARLAATGRLARLATPERVEDAVREPPPDTRAWFRGRCISTFGDAVAAASWDSVIFDVPGEVALQRVATPDPTRGTRASVGELLDRCDGVGDLVAALIAGDGPSAAEL